MNSAPDTGAQMSKDMAVVAEALRHPSVLAALLRLASADHALNPSSPLFDRVIDIRDGDILDFPNSEEQVEVDRLRRVISNSALASKRIADYFRQAGRPIGLGEKPISIRVARRYAITMRDSLGALSRLIGAEVVSSTTPDWIEPEEEITGRSRESIEHKLVPDDDEIVVIYYDTPAEQDKASLLAEVYRRLKNNARNMRRLTTPPTNDDWDAAAGDIEAVMAEISSHDYVRIIDRRRTTDG